MLTLHYVLTLRLEIDYVKVGRLTLLASEKVN